MIALALLVSLYEESTGEVAERLYASLRDTDGLRDCDAPIVQPNAGHEMDGHVWLQHGLVDGAQRNGALAPVGWVIEANRVAAAGILDEAVAGDGAGPGGIDVARTGFGFCHGAGRVSAPDPDVPR